MSNVYALDVETDERTWVEKEIPRLDIYTLFRVISDSQ